MQIKLIFTRKVVRLTSFWNRGVGELGNGLLFQYCLGSGLGTTGDFSSEQLLLTWPHWLPLALNVFSAQPRQHKLIQRARRYSTTWHDDVVCRSAIYLCPLWWHLIERVRDLRYGVSYKSLDFVNSRLELVPFLQECKNSKGLIKSFELNWEKFNLLRDLRTVSDTAPGN